MWVVLLFRMEGGTSNFTIKFIEDLHTYFPDLLYNSERFETVQDVLGYIQQGARDHYNVFDRRRQEHRRTTPAAGTAGTAAPAAPAAPAGVPTSVPTAVATPVVPEVVTTTTTENIVVSSTPIRLSNPPPRIRLRASHPVSRYFGSNLMSIFDQEYSNPVFDDFTTSMLTSLINTPMMESVVIRPTEAQIAATTTLLDPSGTTDLTCTICQEDIDEESGPLRRINACQHVFHKTCIDVWFQQSVACPMCRIDIRDTIGGVADTGSTR